MKKHLILLTLIFITSSFQAQVITWRSTSGLQINADNTILKTASDGWTDGIAISRDKISRGEDGGITMILDNDNTIMSFGLDVAEDNDASTNKGLDYGIFISKGTMFKFTGGVATALRSVRAGQVLSLRKENGYITYYLDDQELSKERLLVDQIFEIQLFVYTKNGVCNPISLDQLDPNYVYLELDTDNIDYVFSSIYGTESGVSFSGNSSFQIPIFNFQSDEDVILTFTEPESFQLILEINDRYKISNVELGIDGVIGDLASYLYEFKDEKSTISFLSGTGDIENSVLILPYSISLEDGLLLTPNRGSNNSFRVSLTYPVERYKLTILNSANEPVFTTDLVVESWDGRIGGEVVPASYYYEIELDDVPYKGEFLVNE